MCAVQGQIRGDRGVGAVIDRPLQPTGQSDITGKPHGTHICVPYKPAGSTEPSRNMATTKIRHPVGVGHAPPATEYYNEYNGLVCRGGIYAARRNRPDVTIYRENCTAGWGHPALQHNKIPRPRRSAGAQFVIRANNPQKTSWLRGYTAACRGNSTPRGRRRVWSTAACARRRHHSFCGSSRRGQSRPPRRG